MENGCAPGDPRRFLISWSTLWPTSSEIFMEGTAVHELGHSLGFPDVIGLTTGVMRWAYDQPGSALHLYPIDQNSLRAVSGTSLRRQRVHRATTPWSGWSSPIIVPNALANSVGATVERNFFEAGRPALVADRGATGLPRFQRGDPTSTTGWVWFGAAPSSDGSLWVSGARGSTPTNAPIMLAWLGPCTTGTGCTVETAYFATPASNPVYSTLPNYTFARAEVTYDVWRQRFVLALIDHATAQIVTTWWTGTVWDTPVVASSSINGAPERFRYMGGIAFSSSGSGVFAGGYASPVASVSFPGILRQAAVTVVGGDYYLAPTVGFGANPLDFTTRRHFGIAQVAEATGTIRYLAAWRGTSSTRSWNWASRASTSTYFGAATESIAQVINSVDVAAEASGSATPYVGVFNQ